MGTKLSTMTLRSLFTKPETLLYPFETKEAPAELKGTLHNDMAVCIFCGACARVCPADALLVDRKEKTWSINRYRCVQCRSCMRACPKDCLTMDNAHFAPTRLKSIETYLAVEPDSALEGGKKELEESKAESKQAALEDKLAGMDPEKAAKVKAAMEAKAKREAEASEEASESQE